MLGVRKCKVYYALTSIFIIYSVKSLLLHSFGIVKPLRCLPLPPTILGLCQY
jgi:hypothetical protein